MRRRPRPVVAEPLPAHLKTFVAAAWTEPGDLNPQHDAEARWSAARLAWHRDRGLDFVESLRAERKKRRSAMGWR